MQTGLFTTSRGRDGLPPRVEPAIEARPRDRATVGLNHAANSVRAGGKFDALIAEFLTRWVALAEQRAATGDGDGWSKPFRFELDPMLGREKCPSCAGYVMRRSPEPPAADTCRRRGTALADRLGYELHNVNGKGLYRVRRALATPQADADA